MTQQNSQHELILKTVNQCDLPPIPHVLQEILASAQNPQTRSTDLEKLVAREAILSSQLLRWVNSPLYALPRKISSVGHAMIILGFSTVKNLASSLLLVNGFSKMEAEVKKSMVELWSRGLTQATLVRYLAQDENNLVQDNVFLAAMLKDFGLLVMKMAHGQSWQNLNLDELKKIAADQNQKLEFNYLDVIEHLLESWHFPADVIELVVEYKELLLNLEAAEKPQLYPSYILASEFLLDCIFEFASDEKWQFDNSMFSEANQKILQKIDWDVARLNDGQSEMLELVEGIQKFIHSLV